MNRNVSLIACTAALAAVTGFAYLTGPGDADTAAPAAGAAAAPRPVERTSLLCPPPSQSDLADTTYTSFSPKTRDVGTDGTAALVEAGEGGTGSDTASPSPDKKSGSKKTDDEKSGKDGKPAKPVLELKEPGTPAETETSAGGAAPALLGIAEGRFAPGWTTQQTTEVSAGIGRGLQGFSCSAPDTDFWFPGASTSADRTDYVVLTNPDDSAAVVDIELYGKDGPLDVDLSPDGTGVGPQSSKSVMLSTLTDEAEDDLTVHVSVTSGRVGATVQALDGELGGDWLAASADPADSLVLPGIPKDATDVRLIVFTPADSDVDLNLKLASPTGSISPAGHESVHVKGGMTNAFDLGNITREEAGSLLLTPSESAVPVVAALQVVRGKGAGQETAYIPATAPLTDRATAAGNTAKGTVLSVTAPQGAAKIKVTASAGSKGGSETSKEYDIKAGTTQELELPEIDGLKGTYALTVEHVSGGSVYASRTLTAKRGGVSDVTVQTLPDDRGMVAVPEAKQDLSVLQK